MALFNGLVAGAFVNLSARLSQRLVDTPGYVDDFSKMADEIIRELKNATPTGYSIEDEAEVHGQAIREVRKNFDEILGKLRQRGQP